MIERFLDKTSFDSQQDYYNNFKINVPENFNFGYDIIDEWAKKDPKKIALLWLNEEGEEKQFTFQDMKEQSDKAASFFKSLGVKRGDMVMLILQRRYEFWISMVALHKLGATAIPATHLLTKKDIVYRNNAADIKMIISSNKQSIIDAVDASETESPTLKIKACLEGVHEGWHNFTEGVKNAEPMPRPTGDEHSQNSDILLMYFTSGTTGLPKMVAHDFSYPLGHIITASYWQCIDETSIHLTVADTGWAKCAWGKLYGQWIAGSTNFVYDHERFNADTLLSIISKYKLTSFCAPPTVYRFFIKEDLTKYDFSNLKHLSCAGEPLNPEVSNQVMDKLGLTIYDGFGQTETTCIICNTRWITPRPGSMGMPSPHFNADIINEDGESCEVGEIGEIAIRTPNGTKPAGLFCEYYRAKDLTDEAWYDDIYHTGDLAWKDEDGFFWFEGRKDDIIKSSGYRIGPFEVESAMIEHASVIECAITAVPDPDRGQIVKATVVLANGYTPSDELIKELQDHVKRVTAPYKYPRIIDFVDELPKTISGKIKRKQIREEGHNK